jgi:bacteriocin-like protein
MEPDPKVQATESAMESVDQELFQSPLTDEDLQEVSGGAITWTYNEGRTGLGGSRSDDEINDGAA